MEAPDYDDESSKFEPIGETIPPSTSAPKLPKLDAIFNFELVVFQVDNTLFKVPRHGFIVPGTIFEAMFTLPTTDTTNVEGTSVESPIILSRINENYFRAFLNALYPQVSSPEPGYKDWIGVLHLATMWNFSKIRASAITALSNFPDLNTAAQKILLGRRYNVYNWVREGLIEVCKNNAITLEDLYQHPYNLGWETISKIFYIRDRVVIEVNRDFNCTCETNGKSSTSYGINKTQSRICRCRCSAKVDEIFRAEMAVLQYPEEIDERSVPPTSGKGKRKKGGKA